MKRYLAGLMILGLLGCVAFAAAQEKPAPGPKAKAALGAPGQRGQMPLERLKNALGLTDEQVAKLQDNRKSGQEAQQAFRDQMQKLRGELNPMLRDPKADPGKVNGHIDRIAKLSAEQAKKGFAGRQNLAKILTPEQLTKLQNLRGLGARGMAGRGGARAGIGMRGRMGMGRGLMMGPRGGMMMRPGMGRGMGPGGRMGMGFGPGRGPLQQRGFRGWRWIR